MKKNIKSNQLISAFYHATLPAQIAGFPLVYLFTKNSLLGYCLFLLELLAIAKHIQYSAAPFKKGLIILPNVYYLVFVCEGAMCFVFASNEFPFDFFASYSAFMFLSTGWLMIAFLLTNFILQSLIRYRRRRAASCTNTSSAHSRTAAGKLNLLEVGRWSGKPKCRSQNRLFGIFSGKPSEN